MHGTLTTRASLLTLAGAAVVAAGAALVARSVPVVALAVGAAFGVVVGVLQSIGIARAGDAFRQAATAMDVRRAFLSTSPGSWSVVLQWAGVVAVFAPAIWNGSLLDGGLLGVIAGYAALVGVRELVTLRAVRRLGEGYSSARNG